MNLQYLKFYSIFIICNDKTPHYYLSIYNLVLIKKVQINIKKINYLTLTSFKQLYFLNDS